MNLWLVTVSQNVNFSNLWFANRSSIANETEYFFTDIEFADSEIGARADMVGFKWTAADRKDGLRCTPALVEMKYGMGAFEGSSTARSWLIRAVRSPTRVETRSGYCEGCASEIRLLQQ
jgi:hypothetical protein